jgi:hypothetical protein
MKTGFGTVLGGTANVHPSSLWAKPTTKKTMSKLMRENAE